MTASWYKMLLAGLAAILLTCLVTPPILAQDASVYGTWLTEKGDARINVSKCGGAICGKIAWLREPIDPDTGKPQTDNHNSNPSLANRPLIGVNLFNNMRSTGANSWAGSIYNAEDGQFYASKITLEGPSRLHVEGCVGALCGGEIWTRSR